MKNCANAKHEMKVTSSQQMMSLLDFPTPINDKQKEPHSVQRKSIWKLQPKQVAAKLTFNKTTNMLVNEKEKEHLPGKKAVTENIT